MPKPRDHHEEHRVGGVKAARVLSNVLSPPVIFAGLGLALALAESPLREGLAWAAVYVFCVSLAPILFVVYLLRSGRIAELHMTDRRERRGPYIVAVIGSAIALALLVALQGPSGLRCLATFNVIGLTALAVITVYWLISMHATAATGSVLIAGLYFGTAVAVALAPLALLVCWARLYLKRHTPAQVVAGVALGAATVGIPVLLGIFP